MAGLFDLPNRSSRASDSKVAGKANQVIKPAKTTRSTSVSSSSSLLEKIASINTLVSKTLGQYESEYVVIRDETGLEGYIDSSIENGVVAIDTETSGLDPITDVIAGLCLYTPGMRAAYVPINHVHYVTGEKIENQLSAEFVAEQLERIVKQKVKTIFFNAKFDIRVIKHQLGLDITPYWDAYIAARLLNENELENGLKALHKKYCAPEDAGEVFSYEDLFKTVAFPMIPIQTAYLYAARDPLITYELFQFQQPYLTEDSETCIEHELQGPAWVFWNIEMPLVPVVAKMESTGIAFDMAFAKKLEVEYERKLEEKKKAFEDLCLDYATEIKRYRTASKDAAKLESPINIGSPTQIAILLYDVLKIPPVSKDKPRGTGEEILLKIDHPLSKAILEYRGIAILLKTFITKMPTIVNKKTGRIHASFNQMGADTGRFSSSDPNMQNIPSHNKDIRKMFKATDGYYLLSADYSAQEPRLTAHMSQDKKMIEAYCQGRDMYVEVASIAFDLPYDECKEFRADGSKNPEGKERRNIAKAIVLGVCYGKGISSIAEDLGITKQKAQKIYDRIMTSFPGLRNFMDDSERMARTKGYVTTVWGRKRRLPNIQLPAYEFTRTTTTQTRDGFDPLFDGEVEVAPKYETRTDEVDEATCKKYTKLLNSAYGNREKIDIKERARKEGIVIKDNGGFIAEAVRQTVNSRIQGSAAEQTKLAMILIGNDEKLNEWGFRLILPVHDELIGECPKENIKPVAERFSRLMETAAKLAVPSKCDVEITECWYGDTIHI